MRLATVQFDPEFGEKNKNIQRVFSLIENVEADLFILPELCFTGYTFISVDEARSMGESAENGFTLNQITELSKKIDAGIIYGFPEIAGEKLYNSCAFVTPEGNVEIYRKLHLYYYEKEWFTPGDRPPSLTEFRGAKIGMMICFDWIFPEVCRTMALMGANLICHPSNLVMKLCQNAMVTRSIENRVYTATCNRIGRESRGEFDFEFTGGSQILSTTGEILHRCSSDKEEVGVADIVIEKSNDKKVNFKNDLWADRRPGYYRTGLNGKE